MKAYRVTITCIVSSPWDGEPLSENVEDWDAEAVLFYSMNRQVEVVELVPAAPEPKNQLPLVLEEVQS